jgi:hypothetical protein
MKNVETNSETQSGVKIINVRGAGSKSISYPGQEPCTSSFVFDSVRALAGGESSHTQQG